MGWICTYRWDRGTYRPYSIGVYYIYITGNIGAPIDGVGVPIGVYNIYSNIGAPIDRVGVLNLRTVWSVNTTNASFHLPSHLNTCSTIFRIFLLTLSSWS